tara:strand:+ start:2238 stop:2441 length:204 start_codon:yes stop_codon:yes gene_type:complete
MKITDLVGFDRDAVNRIIDEEDADDSWMSWIGVVTQIEDECFCRVMWMDGIIRQEYMDCLEVICGDR